LRATTAQKCVRAAEAQRPGKCGIHEAASHVFEMLEIFVWDYFKKDAWLLRGSCLFPGWYGFRRQVVRDVFGGAEVAPGICWAWMKSEEFAGAAVRRIDRCVPG